MSVDKRDERADTPCTFTAMEPQNLRSQKRLIFAFLLFIASIGASFLISLAGDKKSDYWILTRSLPEGAEVHLSDLRKARANLAIGEHQYLEGNKDPSGMFTQRRIHAGELLNREDLSEVASSLHSVEVSLALEAADIPSSLNEGEIVTVFQLFDAHNGEIRLEPKKILEEALIAEVNRESMKFGDQIKISLVISESQLPELLRARSAGRIILVAAYGS